MGKDSDQRLISFEQVRACVKDTRPCANPDNCAREGFVVMAYGYAQWLTEHIIEYLATTAL